MTQNILYISSIASPLHQLQEGRMNLEYYIAEELPNHQRQGTSSNGGDTE